jgi:cytochrome P450
MAATLMSGPRGRWLTGSLREFGGDRLAFLTHCAREFGDFVPFRLGPRRAYLVSHPDLIEEVLIAKNRQLHKHFGLRYFRSLIGNGLLTSEGDFWLRQRRMIQPAFRPERLNTYAEVMVRLTERMLACWHEGDARDIHQDMAHLTLAIAAKTLFDVDASAEAEEVTSVLRVALRVSSERFGSFLPLPEWVPTPRNIRLKRAVRRMNGVISRLIEQRRSRPDRVGNDLLSTLLHARDVEDGTGMTEQQLRDEVMTLFLAGHGTTANALSWSWYLLATHREAEARLVDEIRSVLGERPVTPADLPKMPFLEGVMHESMRLYPPAYLIGREAMEDLHIGEHPVRAGETVFMSQWVVHRDPRFFDEPDAFRPERWAGGLMKRLPKYAYFPFGGGPRFCIGNTFALLELPLILATLAQRYRFTIDPTHEVKPWPAVTLRPENGIRAVLRRR